MNTRRKLMVTTSVGLLAGHRLSLAQPTGSLRRVGILGPGSIAISGPLFDAFKEGMSDLGWRERSDVEYLIANAHGDLTRMDRLALELVSQQPDVLVTAPSQGVRALQRATKTIPIVMTNPSNAVGNGFVASLARPGGNITGITSQLEDVIGNLIGILHETIPGARRENFRV